MKVREGNDVRGLRITIPNESTLSFNSVSNLKVVAQRATDKSSTIVADKVFIENDKTIDIYFRAVKARGKHHVLVSFSIPAWANCARRLATVMIIKIRCGRSLQTTATQFMQ